ncbi:hypothetical protein DY000_02008062 [Brassica cretica]|uniref:Uncharacterized protein n=1 Tax=Brassica cretica TaxID=69181 RepID=A0ABQ7C441_BRACR|nr:hypothetical protein DY000_02008062 [Brassica cretica]
MEASTAWTKKLWSNLLIHRTGPPPVSTFCMSLRIPGEKREKVDLSVGFSVRPARERACRRRSSLPFSINCPAFVSSPSPPAFALSKLWPTTTRGDSVLGVKTRLLGGYGVVKTLVVWVLISGDGGFHSFVAAGFCFREVVVSSASPSSALVSGGEGYNSFASPALALALLDEISKSNEALRRVDRVGRTEMVSAEALQVLSSDEMKLR